MRKGFAVIEWLVILSICAILAAIFWPIAQSAEKHKMAQGLVYFFYTIPFIALTFAVVIAVVIALKPHPCPKCGWKMYRRPGKIPGDHEWVCPRCNYFEPE